ncbi:hypothetical protein H8R18_02255 [Nanchangia anserum]|uniref:Uncharacterized protein n=1 Tax=Nanchangia anserum TaxID=2692125 RepID=A0A8I0GD01_9ACTO|nr:DUF6350 family protein [Nanchangia anserum]MBD3690001.1 hypothetical protein [Nanchangia anserum]QOX82198.1 hypothetical protein H8R18_02255 [Nanchangia anserum]
MPTSTPRRREIVLRLPDGAKRAVAAGIGAALIPWLVIQIIGVITVTTQSGNPWLVDISLGQQVAALTSVWAGGFFVPLRVEALGTPLTITLAPWGLTLAYVWVFARLVARKARPGAPWCGWVSYVVTVAAVGAMTPNLALGRLCLGALALGCLGAIAAAVRIRRRVRVASSVAAPSVESSASRFSSASQRDRDLLDLGIDQGSWTLPLGQGRIHVPGWLGQGISLGLRILAGFGICGVVLIVAAVALSFDEVNGVRDLLPVDTWGTIVLVLAHLAYLPMLAAWAYAWVLGVGYTLGDSTHFSAFDAQSGPIPAVPVFVAAPDIHVGWWAIVIVVALALLIGAWLGGTHQRYRVKTHVLQVLTVAVTMGVGLAVVFRLSVGSLGEERLAIVGVDWTRAWGAAMVESVVPGCVLALLMHPGIRAAIARGCRACVSGAHRGASRLGIVSTPPAAAPAATDSDEQTESEGEASSQSADEPPSDRPARIARVERNGDETGRRTRLRVGTPERSADDTRTSPVTFVEEADEEG